MAKILAQSKARTRQTDNSDPNIRLPEMSNPTRIFGRIWIRNSVTRSNRVEFGFWPKTDLAQPVDNPNSNNKGF